MFYYKAGGQKAKAWEDLDYYAKLGAIDGLPEASLDKEQQERFNASMQKAAADLKQEFVAKKEMLRGMSPTDWQAMAENHAREVDNKLRKEYGKLVNGSREAVTYLREALESTFHDIIYEVSRIPGGSDFLATTGMVADHTIAPIMNGVIAGVEAALGEAAVQTYRDNLTQGEKTLLEFSVVTVTGVGATKLVSKVARATKPATVTEGGVKIPSATKSSIAVESEAGLKSATTLEQVTESSVLSSIETQSVTCDFIGVSKPTSRGAIYEKAIEELYSQEIPGKKHYKTEINGVEKQGIADGAVKIPTGQIAIEAKYVKDWLKSIHAPK